MKGERAGDEEEKEGKISSWGGVRREEIIKGSLKRDQVTERKGKGRRGGERCHKEIRRTRERREERTSGEEEREGKTMSLEEVSEVKKN